MKNIFILTILFIQFSTYNILAQNIDSLLIEAVKGNKLNEVIELVKKGANVNYKYNYKADGSNLFCYPIHLAVDSGYYELRDPL